MDGSLSLSLRAESGRGGEIWPRKKVPKWHHSQATSLSLSLTQIAFVRAMPTQQSKCDVQYLPDSVTLLSTTDVHCETKRLLF